MEPLRVSELVRATGGELVGGDERASVTGVTTDSRRTVAGQFFVPLVGERFDGHDFIVDALGSGASGTFVARTHIDAVGPSVRQGGDAGRARVCATEGGSPTAWAPASEAATGGAGVPIVIVVENTLAALHALARHYRRKFDIPVIAVTGSVGKTTTKDTIASVLSERYRTLKTWKNYNNEVGVPLTMLQITREHQVVVLELGMRAQGEIARLAELCEPSIGVVTNVAEVHLETLGSLDAIACAKAELVAALPRDGLAVLNGDDARVRRMADDTAAASITYGLSPDRDMWADDVETGDDGTPTFTLNWRGDGALPSRRAADRPGPDGKATSSRPHRRKTVRVNMPGAHHVWSAMPAAICGLYFGMEWDEVARGLERVQSSGLRMDISEKDGVTWINDSYNASPLSVKTALGTLRGLSIGRGRPVAVLGDMLELGEASERAHRDVGREVARLEIPLLITVGPAAQWIADEASTARPQTDVNALSTVEQAASFLHENGRIVPGDVVLLKASRGMALERLLEAPPEGGMAE